ncbi:CoA pyrophosphatase [uncultured Ferrimonas sp.]|uniref:NUDIX hydrolase n=1 Tax=uncultured Ferrimonas sp. TaxID=432640 RepID=UPI002623BCD9|nr:CoA pyrophosphatase [uncultured Ferrimonas sp.]
MTTDEFLTRFLYNPRPALEDPLQSRFGNHPRLRDAAVLIALEPSPTGLQILLTERTSQMPTHAGEVAFPGGKVDANDADPWHTATRESWEEIGLPASHLHHVGELAPFHTISKFKVSPQVAIVTKPFEPQLSSREVARLFRAPLADFLDPQQRSFVRLQRHDALHQVYFMPHNVWGATAAMMEQLVRHLGYGQAANPMSASA